MNKRPFITHLSPARYLLHPSYRPDTSSLLFHLLKEGGRLKTCNKNPRVQQFPIEQTVPKQNREGRFQEKRPTLQFKVLQVWVLKVDIARVDEGHM